jgi:hypothetical protein
VDDLQLSNFGPYGTIFTTVCVVITIATLPCNAVKGFWALRYNIYECVLL